MLRNQLVYDDGNLDRWRFRHFGSPVEPTQEQLMKSTIWSFLAAIAIASHGLSARADDISVKRDISLEVFASATDVFVLVVNRSPKSISIAYPFPLTIGKSKDGLEFTFNRIDQKAAVKGDRKLCALVDGPLERFPAPIELHAGTTIGARFGLDELQALHCVENGTYEVRITYYNSAVNAELDWRELHAKVKLTLDSQGRKPPGSASRIIPKTE